MKLITIVIVIIFLYQNVVLGDNVIKRVEELEKEKKELYNQINTAIEDSVRTLRKSNDSESITGLKYMEELKRHISDYNKTDNGSISGVAIDSRSDLENRRRFSFKDLVHPGHKKPNRDPFDIEAVLRPKKASGAEWQDIIENRIKMQKRLDEWILEKQKEKERLKEYKLSKKRLIMSGRYEKCPRFGYSSSNKKNIQDKDKKSKDKKDGVKKKNSKRKNYPCCRKCCKKSYMGCL